MVEVNNSTATVNQWETGVFLKVDSTGLPDNKFLVEYEHSDQTLNCDAMTLQRIGKTYGDFALVPVPNYLLTVAGTVTVSYCNETVTVTVETASEPSGYATSCKCDNDVDRAATADVETRLAAIIDVIYPIGSIYISVSNTSPETLFGGEWDAIEDTFLLAAGTNHSAGDTGGAESQTLTDHKHLSPVGHRSYTNVALNAKYGSEGSKSFTGTKSVWSATQNTTSYNDVTMLFTSPAGGETINTMPPYLAVYMWKRTG